MTDQTITYVVSAGCGGLALLAFLSLVLVPVLSSYRGAVARIGAFILSLYVLAAFVGLGILLGLFIFYKWPQWF